MYRVYPAILRDPPPGITLLKVHGSCNYLPADYQNFKNVTFKNNGINFSGPVRIAGTDQELYSYYQTDDSLAPAMALYAKGKKVLFCPDFVSAQQQQFVDLVQCAKNIFIIGLRVNEDDEHIWTTLAKSAAKLWYVSPEEERFHAWVAKVERNNAKFLEKTFSAAVHQIPALCC
jgi:hypothetical protein